MTSKGWPRKGTQTVDVKAVTRADVLTSRHWRMSEGPRGPAHGTCDAVRALTERPPARQRVKCWTMRIINKHGLGELEHTVVMRVAMHTMKGIPLVEIVKESLRQGGLFLN